MSMVTYLFIAQIYLCVIYVFLTFKRDRKTDFSPSFLAANDQFSIVTEIFFMTKT